MPRAGADSLIDRLLAPWRRGRAVAWAVWLVVALALGAPGGASRAAELSAFELERADDGLYLSYTVDFELAKAVEDAMAKSVAVYFVVEADVMRERWYWTDKRVAHVSRVWRIVYQPLTTTYRVTLGDLSQTFSTRSEALAAVRRAVRWKLAEGQQVDDSGRYYVEFSFKLDTSLLPRPMQIGIGGQADWSLSVERTQRVP